MLTLREETENRTHELIVNGIVRRATLSDLIRRLEPERGAARPRGLLIHLVSFGGFTAEGLWMELGRCMEQADLRGRLAVVAERRWADVFGKEGFPRVAEVRFYPHERLDEARAWLSP